ncbi:MAG: PAS domain S-box protein, partial [Nitrospira sp.]|nr:PAS domain S-box protein [Nitrospira sp.]
FFRLIRIETWMPPLLIDLTDTLLLCVAASFLILYWVVKPMKILEEREKTEAALQESERRLSEAQTMAQLGSWVWDVGTGNVEWSEEVYKIFQLDRNKFIPHIESILALSPWPEDHVRDKELISKAMGSHEKGSYEQRFLRPDRSIGYYYSTFQGKYDDGGNLISIVGTVMDITERKQAEEALRVEKDKAEQYLNIAEVILVAMDDQARITLINRKGCQVLGYEYEELIGLDWFKVCVPPDEAEIVFGFFQRVISGEIKFFEYHENRVLTKNGDKRDIAWHNSVLTDKTGRIVGTLSSGEDITERKKAEEQLRLDHQIMANINDGVCLIQASDGVIIFATRQFENMFGYKPGELIGKHVSVINAPTEKEPRVTAEEITDELNKHGIWRGEVLNIKKDGTTFWCDASVSSFTSERTGTGTVWVSVHRDITENKKLEDQLRHSQKMEAVGTLAGGVAHDFNNIMNVIIGYASLVMDNLETDSPLKEQIKEVLNAAERAAILTRRLLTFSRKQFVDVKPLNVNELILGLQKMLVRIIKEDIGLHLDLADRRLAVMVDAGQIEQVLINLVSNAKDAMPEGGRLTIGTGLEEIDDEYVTAHGYGKPGMYVLITVADTGQGMDAETKEKIFEPFFTTKGIGAGTGLGLAISYQIIKNHNGYLKVYSEQGKGTTFKIWLPVIEETACLENRTETLDTYKGGNETILVAEDDDSLRKLTRTVLESLGYSVITAEDGEDAVTKFMENRDKIKLVLLDMIMPKKSGKEASEEIRKMSPGIKALFVSGYTMDTVKTQKIIDEGFDFILKPVSPKDLLKKVREILDR